PRPVPAPPPSEPARPPPGPARPRPEPPVGRPGRPEPPAGPPGRPSVLAGPPARPELPDRPALARPEPPPRPELPARPGLRPGARARPPPRPAGGPRGGLPRRCGAAALAPSRSTFRTCRPGRHHHNMQGHSKKLGAAKRPPGKLSGGVLLSHAVPRAVPS